MYINIGFTPLSLQINNYWATAQKKLLQAIPRILDSSVRDASEALETHR